MFESIVSLVALAIARLAYYRATRRQRPSVCFFASNEDPFDPDWRIRIHNPTPCPVYLQRVTIREPSPDMDQSIWHQDISHRATVERAVMELDAARCPRSERRRADGTAPRPPTSVRRHAGW